MPDKYQQDLLNTLNSSRLDPAENKDDQNTYQSQLRATLESARREQVPSNQFNLTEVPVEFNPKPLFTPDISEIPGDQQSANAESILPQPVASAVNEFIINPAKRIYDNFGSGINSFNHSIYSGLREVSKVVEDVTGAKHNASDFFDEISREIKKRGITPQSEHWADKLIFMIGDMLPSAAMGIGGGVAAQQAAQHIAGVSARTAPAIARFLGEATAGAAEGVARSAQAGADLSEGATSGAEQFALFEIANAFGSRYNKAFQIAFSTGLGGAMAAMNPNATKDDIAATAILGAIFALPGRTKSGDIKVDFDNVMKWVKQKRSQGVDPTPSAYMRDKLPASLEQASIDDVMDPYNLPDKSPYDSFKDTFSKETGIDIKDVNDDIIFSKMSEDMGEDAASAFLSTLKRSNDEWVKSVKSLDDIVEVPRGDRVIKVPRRVAEQIPQIEKNIEAVRQRELELQDSLIKKPAERIKQFKRATQDAFLNIERRLEAEFEKFPEGRDILAKRNIQNASTSISELNVNEAFKDIGLIGEKNKMSPEMKADFTKTADALTQIDKIKREPEYQSPLGKGQKAIDQYEFIVADMKSKYGQLDIERGESGFSIKGDNDLSIRLEKYFGYYRKYLKDLETSGVISKQTFDKMKNVVYSPTQYIEFLKKELDFESDIQREALFGVKKLGKGKADANITSPEYLLAGHINRVDYVIAKNEHLKSTYDFALQHPDNLIARTVESDGFHKPVKFKRNGEVTTMYMSDDFAKAYEIDSLFSSNYSNVLKALQIASGSTLVKESATGVLNPIFGILAIPRDFFFFNLNNPWKGQTNILPIDIARGAKGIKVNSLNKLLETDKYKQFVRAGGASSTMANEMKRLAFAERNARFIGKKSKVMQTWDKTVDRLSVANHSAEVAVRMHFADLIYNNGRNGLSYEQAVGETSRMLDFRRRGPIMEAIEIAFPYSNVMVQALERSFTYGLKHSKKAYAAKLSQWAAASYALSTAVYWIADMIGDDELKQSYLNALANDSMDQKLREARLPIGFYDKDKDGNHTEYVVALKKEQHPVTTLIDGLIQMGLEYTFLGREPSEEQYQEIRKAAIPFDYHNFIPPTVKAAMAIWGNFDATNMRQISDPSIPQSERVKNASELSKIAGQSRVGKAMNLSPEGLDVAGNMLFPSPLLKGVGKTGGTFLKLMLGIDLGGMSPEAQEALLSNERDIARAFTEMPFMNQIIKKSTQGGRLMRDLDTREKNLMSAQQQRVNQPVLELVERMKLKEIDFIGAVNQVRSNTSLTEQEKQASVEKLKTFYDAERLYEEISQRKRFKDSPLSPGMLSSWRRYYSLYTRLSAPDAGENAAEYVVTNFLSTGDDPELKRVVRQLGAAYLPRKHRAAYNSKFSELTKE